MLTNNSIYQKCTLSTLDAGDSWRSRPQLSRAIAGDNDVYWIYINKRSVSAEASAFTPNYRLGVDLFNSKSTVEVKSQRDSNDNLLFNSLKV